MSWWNLGGLNPQYKNFVEKYPEKTLIGMLWAMQWRIALLVIILEILFLVVIILVSAIFSH